MLDIIASQISINCNRNFHYRQCQDKLKQLKKRWAEIGSDRTRTGNNVDEQITVHPYDELLSDYFLIYQDCEILAFIQLMKMVIMETL